MGTRTIPAVTVRECDRCNRPDRKTLDNPNEVTRHDRGARLLATAKSTQETLSAGGEMARRPVERELLLCDDCAAAFETFFGGEYVPRLDRGPRPTAAAPLVLGELPPAEDA